jgi:glycosyltransferase involved in cell wall biosynthesis
MRWFRTLPGSRPAANSKSALDGAHLVHVMPSFAAGGAQVRMTQIANYLGPRCRHTILTLDGNFEASTRISPEIDLAFEQRRPGRNPLHAVQHWIDVLRARRPDLILTYNWGGIDAALAACISGLAPLIHAEDGFGDDEAVRQMPRRVWFRRIVLRHADAVVGPSLKLTGIMRNVWRVPSNLVVYIPNGVDTRYFAPAPRRFKAAGCEFVVGTAGHLRREKRQDFLIEACAALHRFMPVRLEIAGDGPERPRLVAMARAMGFADNVHFLGHVPDLRAFYHGLDVFAMSSSTEQMPLAVLESMASGLPLVSTNVGDIAQMVSPSNRPFIVSPDAYGDALLRIAGNASLRIELGAANRDHVLRTYQSEHMLERYERLYSAAIERRLPSSAFGQEIA